MKTVVEPVSLERQPLILAVRCLTVGTDGEGEKYMSIAISSSALIPLVFLRRGQKWY